MHDTISERVSRWLAYRLPQRVIYWACIRYMVWADNGPSATWAEAVEAHKS